MIIKIGCSNTLETLLSPVGPNFINGFDAVSSRSTTPRNAKVTILFTLLISPCKTERTKGGAVLKPCVTRYLC
jgi:hypothetical protein